MTMRWFTRVVIAGALCASIPGVAAAHSGPPYPIVTTRVVGPYKLSVWSDPDTTDNGSEGGKFWVTLERASTGGTVPKTTRALVTVHPTDRQGVALQTTTKPVRDDVSNQFAGLTLDHEGPYAVRVDVFGPLGDATVTANVDATYDLRPARWLIALYISPFLLVGFLWAKLLLRRRKMTRSQ